MIVDYCLGDGATLPIVVITGGSMRDHTFTSEMYTWGVRIEVCLSNSLVNNSIVTYLNPIRLRYLVLTTWKKIKGFFGRILLLLL